MNVGQIESGQTCQLHKPLSEHYNSSISFCRHELLRWLWRLLDDSPAPSSAVKDRVASIRLFNVHSHTISWSSCQFATLLSRVQALSAVCDRLLIFQGRCPNARTSKEFGHALRCRWSEFGPETKVSVSKTTKRSRKMCSRLHDPVLAQQLSQLQSYGNGIIHDG